MAPNVGPEKADPEKVEAIKNLAQPRTVHQLRSFLGTVNFLRMYVKDLATLAIPLQEMLKKVKFRRRHSSIFQYAQR